jgi:hypothetical protein
LTCTSSHPAPFTHNVSRRCFISRLPATSPIVFFGSTENTGKGFYSPYCARYNGTHTYDCLPIRTDKKRNTSLLTGCAVRHHRDAGRSAGRRRGRLDEEEGEEADHYDRPRREGSRGTRAWRIMSSVQRRPTKGWRTLSTWYAESTHSLLVFTGAHCRLSGCRRRAQMPAFLRRTQESVLSSTRPPFPPLRMEMSTQFGRAGPCFVVDIGQIRAHD